MTRRIPIQLATRESASPRPQAKGVREIYTGRFTPEVGLYKILFYLFSR